MSKQVLDVQQMRHLQELGLDISNASLCYYKQEGWEESYFMALACDVKEKGGLVYYYDSFNSKEYILNEVIPAYSLQEVLDALPKRICDKETFYLGCYDIMIDEHEICYAKWCGAEIESTYTEVDIKDNLIDAAYEMLVWCIENKFVETNKTNEV